MQKKKPEKTKTNQPYCNDLTSCLTIVDMLTRRRINISHLSDLLNHCYSCNSILRLLEKLMIYAQNVGFNFDMSDECENIEIMHPTEPSPFCPFLKVKLHVKSNKKIRTMFFVAKLPRDHEFMAMDEKREEAFYSIFVPYMKPDYAVKCYSYNFSAEEDSIRALTNQPILLMDDLTKDKYKQPGGKLDAHHLIKCMKKLAKFHADSYNMQTMYRSEYVYMESKLGKLNQDRGGTNEPPEDFLLFAISKWADEVGEQLSKKVRFKLYERRYLRNDPFPTLIHGRFLRSKVFFQYSFFGKPKNLKIVGWQAMTIGAPGIDFSRILLSNLPDEMDTDKLEAYCRRMLRIYINKLKKEYPKLHRSAFEKDVIYNLSYSFIKHFMTLENYRTLLLVLNNLGCFECDNLQNVINVITREMGPGCSALR